MGDANFQESGSLFSPGVFIDGIGPPLSQIEEDYRELLTEDSHYARKHSQTAKDVISLLTEIARLRSALHDSPRDSPGNARPVSRGAGVSDAPAPELLAPENR